MDERNLTIGDIAEELGVSKTTISRAISGKGRIGDKTRERVLSYIEEHHYRPNVIARGLAQQKTFNLAVVLPGDYNVVELPFFQKCMLGISRVASAHGYDVLLSMVTAQDTKQLRRAVANRKIDGAILTRTLAEDEPMRFLLQSGMPFVAIGSANDDKVVQIDNDHRCACRELTERLMESGIRKFALIGSDESHIVTKNRRQGFEDAFEKNKGWNCSRRIFMDVRENTQVQKIVEELLADRTECIVSMDDFLCGCVLNALQLRNVAVPEQVMVASFYDSTLLENRSPSVTSIRFNVEELGQKACETLLAMLEGEAVEQRTLLGYEVRLRSSTKHK